MAAFFVDLDGTVVRQGTNEVLPGAREMLEKIIEMSGQIVFTTYRGDVNFKGHKIYSKNGALEAIKNLGVKYHSVIFDIESPRVVINDSGAFSINRDMDSSWDDLDLDKVIQFSKNRIH
jgi:hydroxymethylpyrimidine pyrophosphatase-like HAD family hydrolase